MAKRKAARSSKPKPTGRLRAGGFSLDLDRRCVVRKDGIEERLTPKECALLYTFINRGGQVLTRRFLMKEIWETDYLGDTRTLDVHVRWLREKIEEEPSQPVYLRTVRGVGYRFEAPKK